MKKLDEEILPENSNPSQNDVNSSVMGSPSSKPFSSPQTSPEKIHKRPIRRNKIPQPNFNSLETNNNCANNSSNSSSEEKSKLKDKPRSGRLSPTLSSLIYDAPDPPKKSMEENQQNNIEREKEFEREREFEPEFLPTTIFIGELTQYVEESVLAHVFGRFGQSESIRTMRGKNFAFITFFNPPAARKSVEIMNGGTLMGSRIKVSIARNPNSKAYNPALGKKTSANLPYHSRNNYHDNRREEERRVPEREERREGDWEEIEEEKGLWNERESIQREENSRPDSFNQEEMHPPKRIRQEAPPQDHSRPVVNLKPASDYPDYSSIPIIAPSE